MPIDPATLRGYKPPEEPKPPRDGLRGLAIAGIGTLLELIFFLWGFDDPQAARVFVAAAVIVGALTTLALVVIGYHEDGVLGVLYRLKHPLGTFWGGDDRQSWTVLALAWLVALMVALATLIYARFSGFKP